MKQLRQSTHIQRDGFSEDPAKHDILFRIRRSRFLLARLLSRSTDSSVQVSDFDIQWVDSQLSAIEADAKNYENSPIFSAPMKKKKRVPKRRFIQTILPKRMAKNYLAVPEASNPALDSSQCFDRVNPTFSSDVDTFLFHVGQA